VQSTDVPENGIRIESSGSHVTDRTCRSPFWGLGAWHARVTTWCHNATVAVGWSAMAFVPLSRYSSSSLSTPVGRAAPTARAAICCFSARTVSSTLALKASTSASRPCMSSSSASSSA
jgi:hypothetical protein